MTRGISITGVGSIPISSVSVNYQRNPISEQAMGLGGEPIILDGTHVVTGSFEAPYRPSSFSAFINDIIDVMSGDSSSLTEYTSVHISDEYGSGVGFSNVVVNSFDISMQVKEYAKITCGFIAKQKTSFSAVGAATYTGAYPVFYDSVVTIGESDNIQASGFSVKGEIPIDQDNFIIGSNYLEDIIQNGNGTFSGTLSLAAKEWTKYQASMGMNSNNGYERGSFGNSVTLNLGDGTSSWVIDIPTMNFADNSLSGQGHNRFEKSINWRAPVNSTDKPTFP